MISYSSFGLLAGLPLLQFDDHGVRIVPCVVSCHEAIKPLGGKGKLQFQDDAVVEQPTRFKYLRDGSKRASPNRAFRGCLMAAASKAAGGSMASQRVRVDPLVIVQKCQASMRLRGPAVASLSRRTAELCGVLKSIEGMRGRGSPQKEVTLR